MLTHCQPRHTGTGCYVRTCLTARADYLSIESSGGYCNSERPGSSHASLKAPQNSCVVGRSSCSTPLELVNARRKFSSGLASIYYVSRARPSCRWRRTRIARSSECCWCRKPSTPSRPRRRSSGRRCSRRSRWWCTPDRRPTSAAAHTPVQGRRDGAH